MEKPKTVEFNVRVIVTGTDDLQHAVAAWLSSVNAYPYPYGDEIPSVEHVIDRRLGSFYESALEEIQLVMEEAPPPVAAPKVREAVTPRVRLKR